MLLKKALVTGSAAGIGQAIALDLASRGFDVAIHYLHSQAKADQTCQLARSLGVKAISLAADVTNPTAAQSLVDRAAEHLGGLSVLVNNVGNYRDVPTLDLSVQLWHDLIMSNLHSTFYVTQAALPHLKAAQGARILNFGCASAQHLLARSTNTPYLIAKTGIIIYTKSLAIEIIKDGITANVICPGIAENSFDLVESLPELPTGKPATLKDMSNAAWFFISPEASYITGQVLEVAGGWKL